MSFRTPPQRPCPGCGTSTDDATIRCNDCGYGLRVQLKTSKTSTPHRTLFASAGPSVEERLAREFRCPHCRSFGARVGRIRNFQLYLGGGSCDGMVTCRFCGAIQLFDLGAFESCPGVRWDLIDD